MLDNTIIETIEIINEILVIPIVLLTFILLIYTVLNLWKKDPDIIRSKLFLNYFEFKKAFLLFSIFALVLVLHVSLIYSPHLLYYILNCSSSMAYGLQKFLGLILVLIMTSFVYYLNKSIK